MFGWSFHCFRGKSKSIVTTKHASVGSTSDSIQLLDKNAPARHNGDTVGIAHTVCCLQVWFFFFYLL
jgi:hypothetical protein